MPVNAINRTPVGRPGSGVLRLERILPGPAERVWSYLVEADKRAQWFSGGTTMTATGQTATLHFQHANITDEPTPERWKEMDNGGFRSEVTVLRFDPPKALAYTWPESDGVSEVTFELSPAGGDTRLVLTHRRIGSVANEVSFASGWQSHLDALIQVLNGEKPAGFWANVVKLEKDYREAFGAGS